MKIGVVTSGHEILPLFHILNQYDFSYEVFWDWAYRPRGDKDWKLRKRRIETGIDYLTQQGVERIIVPPVYEVLAQDDSRCLPLFTTYLLEHAFRYSLVGKLGLLCDWTDLTSAEEIVQQVAEQYTLSDHQQAIDSFHEPFALRKKEVRMRKYFLTSYAATHWMVRKTIKHDLRYFKDAAVDTLIPLSRGFLHYQYLIKKQLNQKKIRFHGREAVDACFATVTAKFPQETYQVGIHMTGGERNLLSEQRKWQQLLSKGGQVTIKTTAIDL